MRARGRPRDPDIEARAITAVLDLYDEHGLSSVTFDKVARSAGIGKAALYARWSEVEDLLIDGLEQVAPAPAAVDTGEVERDLRQMILMLIDLYTGPHGRIVVRINLDASIEPALRPYYDVFAARYVQSVRQILERARERGEVAPHASSTLLVEQLFGATMLRIHFSRPGKYMTLAESISFAEGLAANLLRGVSAR